MIQKEKRQAYEQTQIPNKNPEWSERPSISCSGTFIHNHTIIILYFIVNSDSNKERATNKWKLQYVLLINHTCCRED